MQFIILQMQFDTKKTEKHAFLLLYIWSPIPVYKGVPKNLTFSALAVGCQKVAFGVKTNANTRVFNFDCCLTPSFSTFSWKQSKISKNWHNSRTVFPLSRFFSANRRFVGARVSNFLQYSKHSFRKFDKFVEI